MRVLDRVCVRLAVRVGVLLSDASLDLLPVFDLLRVRLREPLVVPVTDLDAETVGSTVLVVVPLMLPGGVAVPLLLKLDVPDRERDALGGPLLVTDAVGEGLLLPLGVGAAEPDAVLVSVGAAVPDNDCEALAVPLKLLLRLAVGVDVQLPLMVPLREPVGVMVALSVGAGVTEPVDVHVTVPVADDVGVLDAVPLIDTVGLRVPLRLLVPVALRVGVALTLRLAVGLAAIMSARKGAKAVL